MRADDSPMLVERHMECAVAADPTLRFVPVAEPLEVRFDFKPCLRQREQINRLHLRTRPVVRPSRHAEDGFHFSLGHALGDELAVGFVDAVSWRREQRVEKQRGDQEHDGCGSHKALHAEVSTIATLTFYAVKSRRLGASGASFLAGDLDWLLALAPDLRLGYLEQSAAHVLSNGTQALITDSLTINTRHVLACVTHHGIDRNLIAGFAADRQFTGFTGVFVLGQEPAAQVKHRKLCAVLRWAAPRVQSVLLVEIALESGVGIRPRAKVDEPPPDFFRPTPRSVGEERKIWIGLPGLVELIFATLTPRYVSRRDTGEQRRVSKQMSV